MIEGDCSLQGAAAGRYDVAAVTDCRSQGDITEYLVSWLGWPM